METLIAHLRRSFGLFEVERGLSFYHSTATGLQVFIDISENRRGILEISISYGGQERKTSWTVFNAEEITRLVYRELAVLGIRN
jgi:hypothetical protein